MPVSWLLNPCVNVISDMQLLVQCVYKRIRYKVIIKWWWNLTLGEHEIYSTQNCSKFIFRLNYRGRIIYLRYFKTLFSKEIPIKGFVDLWNFFSQDFKKKIAFLLKHGSKYHNIPLEPGKLTEIYLELSPLVLAWFNRQYCVEESNSELFVLWDYAFIYLVP